MAEAIKTGDTVRLISGGPLMTVGDEMANGWQVFWFVGDELKAATVPEASLRHATRPASEMTDDELAEIVSEGRASD